MIEYRSMMFFLASFGVGVLLASLLGFATIGSTWVFIAEGSFGAGVILVAATIWWLEVRKARFERTVSEMRRKILGQ